MGDTVETACTSDPPCLNAICDRRTAYTLYQDMQNAIAQSLDPINVELKRAQKYKSHPHSVVFRVKINLLQQQTKDADVQAYAADSKQQNNNLEVVQPFLIDRSVEVIARMQDDRPVDNVRIVEGVLESCLIFQIALRILIDLQTYIHDEMNRFNEVHSSYDNLLAQYEQANASNDTGLVNRLADQISRVQNQLDGQRLVLQRLVNQIPFSVSPIRNENDFMDIYNGVDDTIVIHNFLQSNYVQNVLRDSPILARMFGRLKHHWYEFDSNNANNPNNQNPSPEMMSMSMSPYVSPPAQMSQMSQQQQQQRKPGRPRRQR